MAAELDQWRSRSFSIAYRMLGSVADAEDIVQETMLRVHRSIEGGERIDNPLAYVATITTRLSINALTSARARREEYVGDWLPEPIIVAEQSDPESAAELSDSLSLAVLVLLESLSPEQRAVLLLHDVFGYDYAEIAQVLGTSAANSRQLGARARQQVSERRPRFTSTPEQRRRLTERFLAAAQTGDLGGLESMLAADVTFTGDGGGRVPTISHPMRGRRDVAGTLRDWFLAGPFKRARVAVDHTEVNGGPGVVFRDRQDRVLGVWAFDFEDDRISRIDSVVNPDKLGHLGPVGDFAGLFRTDAS